MIKNAKFESVIEVFGGDKSGSGQVPTLGIQGALDRFGFMARRGRRQAPNVTNLVIEGWGHTLLVGDRLGFAFDWLAKRTNGRSWF